MNELRAIAPKLKLRPTTVKLRPTTVLAVVLPTIIVFPSVVVRSFSFGVAETDRVVRTLPLHPGQSIVVEGTVGEISIQGWDRPDVAVDIVRTVPTRDAFARLPITIDEGPASDLRVSVRQPVDGKDGTLRAAITLSVPKRAHVSRVALFEGTVRLRDLARQIWAVVDRGAIDAARLEGAIRLETTIGAITVVGTRVSPDGMVRLRTFNGDVRLVFAEPPADARILALTLNGHITSVIPLERKDQFGPRFGGAILGTGEPVVSIDVVNGNIAIDIMK